jgi:hypothetical protein
VWLGKNFKIGSKSNLLREKNEVDDDNDNFIMKAKELNQVNNEVDSLHQQSTLSERAKDRVYSQLKHLESSLIKLVFLCLIHHVLRLNPILALKYGIISIQRIVTYGELPSTEY